jgi:hypothetical protein
LETTPRVDIVLRPQPAIKFSGCTYYRTLVNARGLQIRLNEAIYVERLINDKVGERAKGMKLKWSIDFSIRRFCVNCTKNAYENSKMANKFIRQSKRMENERIVMKKNKDH